MQVFKNCIIIQICIVHFSMALIVFIFGHILFPTSLYSYSGLVQPPGSGLLLPIHLAAGRLLLPETEGEYVPGFVDLFLASKRPQEMLWSNGAGQSVACGAATKAMGLALDGDRKLVFFSSFFSWC